MSAAACVPWRHRAGSGGLRLGLALVGVAALAVSGLPGARAETRVETRAVLGPDAGPRLMAALHPFGSGQPVAGGWALGDIAIGATEARLSLTRGDDHATLVLGRALPSPRPASQAAAPVVAVGSSPSFAAWVVGASPPPGAVAAARALVARLRARDDGTFYRLLTDPPAPPGGARPHGERPGAEEGRSVDFDPAFAHPSPDPPPPTVPLGAGLAGALLFFLWGVMASRWRRRAGQRAAAPGSWRGRWGWPVALGAAAWGLRVGLGPMTLLHENAHGIHYLARVLGVEAPLRPMGGVTALHQLLAPLVTPSLGSLVGVHAALGALQAPLVYALTRALGARVRPAALAGAVMAALPLAVRMAGSEDAFTPGTTFALAGVAAFVAGLRRGAGPWMVGGLALVAVAGYFRPLLFTLAAPVAFAAFVLPGASAGAPTPHGQTVSIRHRWLWLAAAVGAYWAVVAPEVPHLLRSLHEGTPMTAGWWNGHGLRNWALLDPGVTPPWVPGVALAGWGALVWRGPAQGRRAALWLGVSIAWMSWWLTSDNGRPASLRYAVGYAWAVAALVGLAVDALPDGARRWALWVAGTLVVATPARYAAFIGHEYAQQAELRFQREAVLPALRGAPGPVTLVTPWPSVRGVGGTTLAAGLGAARLRVADLGALPHLLAQRRRGAGGSLYWYRSLSCYLRISDGSIAGPVPYSPACAAVDAAGGWVPVVTRALVPASDADWIDLGDGHTPVVVGLYRWAEPGARRGAADPGS